MEAILMKANDDWKILNEKKITLDTLQTAVNGCIEAVYLDDNIVMYCNEDGLNLELPINRFATSYGHFQKRIIGFIVGDVVFTKSDDDGNTVGLNQYEMNKIIDFIESYQNSLPTNI